MVFKGALVVAASTAPEGARAEVLAGFFLGAYVGLSIPVIGLGLATTHWAARDVMPIFAALAMLAIAVSIRRLLSGSDDPAAALGEEQDDGEDRKQEQQRVDDDAAGDRNDEKNGCEDEQHVTSKVVV